VPIPALKAAVGRDLLKIECPGQCTVRDIEAKRCVHRAPQWICAQYRSQCSAPCVQCGGESMESLKRRFCRVELAVNQRRWRELDCPVVTSRTPPGPALTFPKQALPGSTKIHSTPPGCIALKFCIVPPSYLLPLPPFFSRCSP
jgi:hypothetical protein